ncbi:MAG: hypothetical protein M3R55_07625 [Acidobacteriota bacterium]|nr:hypothetical protein [Acidobacteriota bacterium]
MAGEVPDRLVTGEQIGQPGMELVVLTSRARPEWERHTYLVAIDGRAYRLGAAFDFHTAAGMRTACGSIRIGPNAIRAASGTTRSGGSPAVTSAGPITFHVVVSNSRRSQWSACRCVMSVSVEGVADRISAASYVMYWL